MEVTGLGDQVFSGSAPDEGHMEPGPSRTRFNRFELTRKHLILDTLHAKLQTSLDSHGCFLALVIVQSWFIS